MKFGEFHCSYLSTLSLWRKRKGKKRKVVRLVLQSEQRVIVFVKRRMETSMMTEEEEAVQGSKGCNGRVQEKVALVEQRRRREEWE
jgi:hypothetical protein